MTICPASGCMAQPGHIPLYFGLVWRTGHHYYLSYAFWIKSLKHVSWIRSLKQRESCVRPTHQRGSFMPWRRLQEGATSAVEIQPLCRCPIANGEQPVGQTCAKQQDNTCTSLFSSLRSWDAAQRATIWCWPSVKLACETPSDSPAQEYLVNPCRSAKHNSALHRRLQGKIFSDLSIHLADNFPSNSFFKEKFDFYPKYTFPHICSLLKLWWLSGRTVLEEQDVLFAVWFLTLKHFLYTRMLFSAHLSQKAEERS